MASLRSDESLQNGGLQVRLKERDEGLQGFEAVPVNSQLPDLGLERLPGNAQSCSSTGRSGNQSTSLPQGILDHLSFSLAKVGTQGNGRHCGFRQNRCEPGFIDEQS